MALKFRPVQRDQQFLLPPDMRQWLAPSHPVWFVIDVIERLNMSVFEARSKLGRAGRAPYDPRALLGVLVYGYANGEKSSRRLERLCGQDVAFRVLTGDDVPDHTTISRFRAENEAAFEDLFVQVLAMCGRAGMGRLGVIAIDGTKIAANASKSRNGDEDRLRAEIRGLVEDAAAIDAAEDAQYGDGVGDEVDAPWRDPSRKQQLIEDALADLLAQKKAAELSDEQKRKATEYEARMADDSPGARMRGTCLPPVGVDLVKIAEIRLAREEKLADERFADYVRRKAETERQGRKAKGCEPVPVAEHSHVKRAKLKLDKQRAKAAARATTSAAIGMRNMTDPDSRLMKTVGGWVQGFNCQLAVTDDQLIIAAQATQDHGDVAQLQPMMAAAQRGAAIIGENRTDDRLETEIGTIVADAGYHSKANIEADGPDRLIAKGKAFAEAKAAADSPAQGPPPADPVEAMSHRMRTPEGSATYARRKVLVEPVNGHLKDRYGMRTMSRRGLKAANSELKLASAVANLFKLNKVALA
jgi:transposase